MEWQLDRRRSSYPSAIARTSDLEFRFDFPAPYTPDCIGAGCRQGFDTVEIRKGPKLRTDEGSAMELEDWKTARREASTVRDHHASLTLLKFVHPVNGRDS